MSIKKIAEKAGVSISTVSRILNRPDYKCSIPGLREKVWNLAMEMNYVPNEAPLLSTCSMNGPLPMSPQAPLPPMENTYFKNNPTDPSSYPFVYGSMNNYSYPLYNSSTPTGGMFLLELLMNRGSQYVPVPMYMWERGFGVSGWSIADSMFELQVFLSCSM